MSKTNLLERVRRICLALPDTEESSRLGGSPHFYVGGKIFAGCGEEDGAWGFGVKVGLELQSLMVTRPGIHVAKYVGRYGWISVDEEALQGEAELQHLIHLSYELITGKAGSVCSTKPAAKKKGADKKAPMKTPAKKPVEKPAKKKAKKAAKKR
ncbi:MAG: MmcQ/YjbR family DNA-binding protein [Planctomycetota bacterium]